jgi:hypothetical protein
MSIEPAPDWIEPEVLVSDHERRGEPLPPLVDVVRGGPVTPLPPLPDKFHPAPRPKDSPRVLRTVFGAAGTVDVKAGVSLLKQLKRAGADETVELHIRLAAAPAREVQGMLSLPHGHGALAYRADKAGWVHVRVGTMTLSEGELVENITALLNAVRAAGNGDHITRVVLSGPDTPGIPLAITQPIR